MRDAPKNLEVVKLGDHKWEWSAYHNSLCFAYWQGRTKKEGERHLRRYVREHNRTRDYLLHAGR